MSSKSATKQSIDQLSILAKQAENYLLKGFDDFQLLPKSFQQEVLKEINGLTNKQINQIKKLLKAIVQAKIDLKTLNNFNIDWGDTVDEMYVEIRGEEKISTGEKTIDDFCFYGTTFSTPVYCCYEGKIFTHYENIQAKPTHDCDQGETYDEIMTWERIDKLKVFK